MPAQSIMKEASDQRGRANPDQSGGINVTDNIQLADELPADVGMIDNNGQELARAKENDARFRSPTLRAGLGLPDEEPIEAIDDAKVAKNRDAVLKHMLKNDMTLEEFKTEHPKEYSMVVDNDSANPDDNFIHRLAEVNRKVYSKDPAKAEATTKRQLKAMGYDMSKLDNRASMYNRISNGTALTVAQGYAGVNKFLEMIGAPDAMRDEMAVDMEKILSETTEADGKLYESLKPTISKKPYGKEGEIKEQTGFNYDTRKSTDVATTAGKIAPLVATGAIGGTSATGVVLGDIIPALAVTAGDPDADGVDAAIAVLSPLAGYGLANSLSKWTKKTYDSVEDFERAIRNEPHLIDDLKKTLKDKKIKLKDIKTYGRTDDLPSRSPNEMWFRSEKPTPKEAKQAVADYKVDMEKHISENIDDYASVKELKTIGHDKLVKDITTREVDRFFKDQARTIASNSANADEFLKNVVKYEELFNELDMKPLVAWAKNTEKLSGGAKADAITSAGLNGLLLASGNPAMANIFPSVFKNWASKLLKGTAMKAKGVLTKPIGSSASKADIL